MWKYFKDRGLEIGFIAIVTGVILAIVALVGTAIAPGAESVDSTDNAVEHRTVYPVDEGDTESGSVTVEISGDAASTLIAEVRASDEAEEVEAL